MPDLKQPFTGRHLLNRRLTGASSSKDTRHHEIGIETPGATYLPGDALGVSARYGPDLVERILGAVGATGDELVPIPGGDPLPVHRALTEVYNLTTPSRRLLELLIERGASHLAPLLDRENAESLKAYLNGWNEAHDVLDVLLDHPSIRLTPEELAGCLRKRSARRRTSSMILLNVVACSIMNPCAAPLITTSSAVGICSAISSESPRGVRMS
jgi:sulfite reductase (NADPH) flavoprotein alpha-component